MKNYLFELPDDLIIKILDLAGATPIIGSNLYHVFYNCPTCASSYKKDGRPRANATSLMHYMRYCNEDIHWMNENCLLIHKPFRFHKITVNWRDHYFTAANLLYLCGKHTDDFKNLNGEKKIIIRQK